MSKSYLSMPLALIPLPTVRHAGSGTFVGSNSMSYTSADVPCISATIEPCQSSLAHWQVAHKVSLPTLKILTHFDSLVEQMQ